MAGDVLIDTTKIPQTESGTWGNALGQQESEKRKQEQELRRQLRLKKLLLTLTSNRYKQDQLIQELKRIRSRENGDFVAEALKALTSDLLTAKFVPGESAATNVDTETVQDQEVKSDKESIQELLNRIKTNGESPSQEMKRVGTKADILANIPARDLDERLSKAESKLKMFRSALANNGKPSLADRLTNLSQQASEDDFRQMLSIDDTKEELAISSEVEALKRALNIRKARNNELAVRLVGPAHTDDDTHETPAIKELRTEILELVNQNKEIDDEAAANITLKLEQLRLAIDEESQRTEGKPTILNNEQLAIYTGAKELRTIKDKLDAIPDQRIRVLAEAAGRGDKNALERYLDLLKPGTPEGLAIEKVMTWNKARKHQPAYTSQLEQLLQKQQQGELSPDDKLELFTLSNTLRPTIEALLVNEKSPDPDIDRYLAKLSQVENENDSRYNDFVSEVGDYARLDFEQIKTADNLQSALVQAKVHLTQDIMQGFFTEDAKDDELIPLRQVRERFKQYGLLAMDIDSPDDHDRIRQIFQDLSANYALESELASEGIGTLLTKGWGELYRWAETGSEIGVASKQQVCHVLELACLTPVIETGDTDAQGQSFSTKSPEVVQLIESLVKLNQVDREIGELYNSDKISLQKLAFKNAVFQRLLLNSDLTNPEKSALLESIRNAVEDTQEDSEDPQALLGKLKQSLIQAGTDQELVDKVVNLKDLPKTYTEMFQLERTPGGLVVAMDSEAMESIWNIGNTEILGGFNMRPEYMIRQIKGKVFRGSMIVVTEKHRDEETAHQLQNSLMSELTGDKSKDYLQKYGLNELTAKLLDRDSSLFTPQALENNNRTALFDLYLTPDAGQDLKVAAQEVDKRYAYLAYRLTREILAAYSEKLKKEGNPAELDIELQIKQARRILAERIRANSTDPNRLIIELARNLQETKGNNSDDPLVRYIESQVTALSQSDTAEAQLTDFAAGLYTDIRGRESNIDIFTGEEYTEIDTEGDIQARIDGFNKVNKILEPAMTYAGKESRTRRKGVVGHIPVVRNIFTTTTRTGGSSDGAGIPEGKNFFNAYEAYRTSKAAPTELDSSPTLAKLIWHRDKFKSYLAPDSHSLRFSHLPIIGDYIINPTLNWTFKKIFPFNQRDFAAAFSNTWLGDKLNISRYRGGDYAKQQGFFNWRNFIWGGNATEQWYKDYRKGELAANATEGHKFPDWIRLQRVDERNLEAFKAMQSIIGGKLSGTELYSLLESTPFMNLINIPGDRPNFDQKIADDKVDKISDFDLQRINSNVFDLHTPANKRLGARSEGGSVTLDGKKFSINYDSNGNFWITPTDPKGKARLLSNEQMSRMVSQSSLDGNSGKAFFDDWNNQTVTYQGQEYYVHYNPNNGLPELYKEATIDWSSRFKPEPLKDVNNLPVQPRMCEARKKVGEERQWGNMDIAVAGLFKQILKVRADQVEDARRRNKTIKPEELYSLRDLVRSMRRYENSDDNHDNDSAFVRTYKDKGMKYRQIFIPNAFGKQSEDVPIDYEVAEEMLTRITKFYFEDKMTRKVYVKKLHPENIMYESQTPENPKVRQMVGEYLQMGLDAELQFADGYKYDVVTKKHLAITAKDPEYKSTYQYAISELDNIKDRSRAGKPLPTDINETVRLQRLVDKYADLQDLESILFDTDHCLFEAKSLDERRVLRSTVRASLVEAFDLQPHKTLKKTFSVLEKEILANPDQAGIKESLDALYKFYMVERHDHAVVGGRPVVNGASATTAMIDKLLGGDLPADLTSVNLLDFEGKTIALPAGGGNVTLEKAAGSPAATPSANIDKFTNSRSIDYDKRTVERFMERFDDTEVKRLANVVGLEMNDQMKVRGDMKGYLLRIMELSDFQQQEFQRYRLAKKFWESMSRWHRRMATTVAVASLGLMAATGAPIFFYAIFASVGYNRIITSYMDKRTDMSANRRNAAKDLAMELKQRVSAWDKMYQEGAGVNQQVKRELEDMLTDYTIKSEGIQDLKNTEKFKPKGVYLIDNLLELLLGEKGVIPQQLAS